MLSPRRILVKDSYDSMRMFYILSRTVQLSRPYGVLLQVGCFAKLESLTNYWIYFGTSRLKEKSWKLFSMLVWTMVLKKPDQEQNRIYL